jgi:cell division protein FtsL
VKEFELAPLGSKRLRVGEARRFGRFGEGEKAMVVVVVVVAGLLAP